MARLANAGEAFGRDGDAVGQLAGGFGRARTAEYETLHHAHAELADELEVVMGLNAFGAGIHAERLGEGDDGANDCCVSIGRRGGAADEALVDLDLVERRFLQIAQ